MTTHSNLRPSSGVLIERQEDKKHPTKAPSRIRKTYGRGQAGRSHSRESTSGLTQADRLNRQCEIAADRANMLLDLIAETSRRLLIQRNTLVAVQGGVEIGTILLDFNDCGAEDCIGCPHPKFSKVVDMISTREGIKPVRKTISKPRATSAYRDPETNTWLVLDEIDVLLRFRKQLYGRLGRMPLKVPSTLDLERNSEPRGDEG